MARSLDQILKELQPTYAGSEKLIKQQQASLQPAADAEISGLQAQLGVANENILNQARRRGIGLSGIPIAEQAKYAATEFAPAVARVKQNQIQQSTTLAEALNQLGRDRMQAAQSILQRDLDRDEQIRQFNQQLKLQREQIAAQERAAKAAAAAASAGARSYLGATSGGSSSPSIRDQAYVSVQSFLKKGRSAAESDYKATLKSANYGNALDKLKVELYHQAGIGRPSNQNNARALSTFSIPLNNAGLRF